MWEKIRILGKIGEGGMGEVLRIYDHARGGLFALKRLHPHLARDKDMSRFRREMENLLLLTHPNVVRILDYSPDPDQLAYLMELCVGSVADMREEFLGNAKACAKVIESIGSAIEYAHALNPSIIHRDIKPSNVLVGADGEFKLSDFGLSVQLDGAQERVTQSSNWISPGFSPPEQYRDFASVGTRADVYSLAATVFFLFTGRTYHAVDDTLREINEPLHRLLEVCLAEEPANRPKDGLGVLGFWKKANSADAAERYSTLRRAQQLELIDSILERDMLDYYRAESSDLTAANLAKADEILLEKIFDLEQDESCKFKIHKRILELDAMYYDFMRTALDAG